MFLTPKGRALKRELVPLAEEVNAVAARGVRKADIAATRAVLLAIIENLAREEAAQDKRMPSTRALARLGTTRRVAWDKAKTAASKRAVDLSALSALHQARMNWLTNVVRPKIRSLLRREVPENLWIKCPETGQLVFYKDVEANQFVIPVVELSHAHGRDRAPEVDVRRRDLVRHRRARRCRSIRSSSATSAATPTGSRTRAPRPA